MMSVIPAQHKREGKPYSIVQGALLFLAFVTPGRYQPRDDKRKSNNQRAYQ